MQTLSSFPDDLTSQTAYTVQIKKLRNCASKIIDTALFWLHIH